MSRGAGADPFLGHFCCWLAACRRAPASHSVCKKTQYQPNRIAGASMWPPSRPLPHIRWAAWHIAAQPGAAIHHIHNHDHLRRGHLAAASEALPQAPWPSARRPPSRWPAAGGGAAHGGLLLLQCVRRRRRCSPFHSSATPIWRGPGARPPRRRRHRPGGGVGCPGRRAPEAKTIQVPRRPPMNDGGDSRTCPTKSIPKPTVCVEA